MVSKVDAHMLGHSETANNNLMGEAKNTLTFTSDGGYRKALAVRMAQVENGATPFRNVDFLAVDIPQVTGFDAVLGRCPLRFTKLETGHPATQPRNEEKERGPEP